MNGSELLDILSVLYFPISTSVCNVTQNQIRNHGTAWGRRGRVNLEATEVCVLENQGGTAFILVVLLLSLLSEMATRGEMQLEMFNRCYQVKASVRKNYRWQRKHNNCQPSFTRSKESLKNSRWTSPFPLFVSLHLPLANVSVTGYNTSFYLELKSKCR